MPHQNFSADAIGIKFNLIICESVIFYDFMATITESRLMICLQQVFAFLLYIQYKKKTRNISFVPSFSAWNRSTKMKNGLVNIGNML